MGLKLQQRLLIRRAQTFLMKINQFVSGGGESRVQSFAFQAFRPLHCQSHALKLDISILSNYKWGKWNCNNMEYTPWPINCCFLWNIQTLLVSAQFRRWLWSLQNSSHQCSVPFFFSSPSYLVNNPPSCVFCPLATAPLAGFRDFNPGASNLLFSCHGMARISCKLGQHGADSVALHSCCHDICRSEPVEPQELEERHQVV